MKKNNFWKAGLSMSVLAVVTVVGGVMAYFTDTDEQVNHFTVGKIEIDLQEPEWDKKPDENEDGVPDEAEDMVPMQKISKDPQVENTGINDACIFMTVEIPCREVITVNPDGKRNPLALTELYSYQKDESWKALGSWDVQDEEGNQTARKYLYAYADESGACRVVKPDEKTNPLFKEVEFANVMEGQGIEESPFDMGICVYGIQAENLNGGVTDAKQIWDIITNQKELTERYE